MPPSWQLSPARSRKDHSLQSQRWCCRRAILYRHDEGAAVIPDSGPEIKNRCTKDGISRQNPTSIPKSGPEIKNQCTKDGISRQNHASIPKSGPEITNQCSRGIAAVCRRNHSSLQKRKIESDAKYAAATAAAGRTILRSRRRKLESGAENRCLNGRAYGSNFIRHSELCEGARLELTMSDQANY